MMSATTKAFQLMYDDIVELSAGNESFKKIGFEDKK